jgi:hypothetical protein
MGMAVAGAAAGWRMVLFRLGLDPGLVPAATPGTQGETARATGGVVSRSVTARLGLGQVST